MSLKAAIFDEEINRLLRETSEALPDHYEIRLSLEKAECSTTLYRPDGMYIEVCTDDMDFARSLAQHAKVANEHAASNPKP